MKFIEMTGEQLGSIINDGEIHGPDLLAVGVAPKTIVRVNQHGDIEVRRPERWDIIGGLIGSFDERIRRKTGFDWA